MGGNATIAGDLAVTGDSSVGGDHAVTGNSTVGEDLTVTGDSSVGGDLTVTGDSSLNDVYVNGRLALDGLGDVVTSGAIVTFTSKAEDDAAGGCIATATDIHNTFTLFKIDESRMAFAYCSLNAGVWAWRFMGGPTANPSD